jgi:hypothetical protein
VASWRSRVQGLPGRLVVAKGYSLKGVEYEEIFSPVVRHTSTIAVLALVAHYDMALEQMNMKTTFSP